MNETDDLIARLDACSVKRDVWNAAIVAYHVVTSAMQFVIRAASEPVPDDDSFFSLMTTRSVQALIRDHQLRHAFDFVRLTGGRSRRNAHITKNQAAQSVDYARGILASIRERIEPAAPAYVFSRTISEHETREAYIDLYLREAGWEVMETKGEIQPGMACIEIEVEGMPGGGNGYADYVLFGRDGLPLAVIEAKRASVSSEKGRQQAELYGRLLAEKYHCAMPVLYHTNGYTISCLDGTYPERDLIGFHSLKELEGLHFRRGRKPIRDLKLKPDIANRPYQTQAVTSLCETFNSLHRRGLLIMATGTGKTRVATALIDILSRNDWVENVLFLADRNELVKQAKETFEKLLPEKVFSVLSERDGAEQDAHIVLSTYQTMIRRLDCDQKQFGIGRFDLVIIDEAHRSVFNKYGAIFDYFDALLVGLTATPREEIDKNTFALFNRPDGEPNFAYDLRQGIRDGYLVGWKLKNHSTLILRDGIEAKKLSESDRQDYDDGFEAANYTTPPDSVEGSQLFKAVYNEPTCDRVIETLMREGLRVENGEILGKTIIFAVNHKHAEMIKARFNMLYPDLANGCEVIDNYIKHAEDLIREFKSGPRIRIAISVDMMDTGVDVPEALNLVFFKQVRSSIKFQQMVGRGTRTCTNLFGEGLDKKYFLCFDYCGNFDSSARGESGEEDANEGLSLSQRLFVKRIELIHALQTLDHQSVEWRRKYRAELVDLVSTKIARLRHRRERITVRKAMPHLDRFCHQADFTTLTPGGVREIERSIAPIMDENFPGSVQARQFDALMLDIELAYAKSGKVDSAASAVMRVRKIAKRLASECGAIDEVRLHGAELKTLASVEFWQTAALESLDTMRVVVRELAKYLKTDKLGLVTLHLADEVLEVAPAGEVDFRSYREKVIDYLADNYLMPVIDKIRKLEPITTTDLKMLEQILWHTLGTREEYEAENYQGSLAGFVRSLVNLDTAAIQEKFGDYLYGNNFNSKQQDFVRSIVDYIIENGEMNPILDTPIFNEVDVSELFFGKMDEFKKLVTTVKSLTPAAAAD